MHYEIYVDSLFFINFIMNLYLLIWVNRSTFHTATLGRILAGSAVGAIGFLITCSGVGHPLVRIALGILLGVGGMPVLTFSVRNFRMFLRLLKQLIIDTFLMGGCLLFAIGTFPGIRRYLTGVAGILGLAGIVFLLLEDGRRKRNVNHNLCRVTLTRQGKSLTVNALVDSGNTLVEPISGKPVCVVEEGLYAELWGTDTAGLRVIPYHSIGKNRGVMMGYPLEYLQVSLDHMLIELKDIYVAVSGEPISTEGNGDIKMIINPEILNKTGSRGAKRQLGEAL